MAYVNVAEWSPDQVTDWLKGLDSAIWNYIPYFLNNEIVGKTLLQIRPDELQKLGMDKIGHQEIVLEAVGHLRNFHYDLDRENLQYLALKLSTAATSLHRELSYCEDGDKLETRILSNVTNTIATIKPLACWLDRYPFSGQHEFAEKRANMLTLAIEMATNGQRDRFAHKPVAQISHMAKLLAKLADEIIQDVSDPMLLQPASLDLATLKKRENDLGFCILPNYHGSLQISDIKFGSPAHTSGKIEEGDEIVQVNYQTIVGWQRQKVLLLFQESPPDILLTLKKRPKHTKIYGQIYMKPYRLPSKKRALPFTRWHDNLPSPRPELLAIPDFDLPLSRRCKPTPEPIIDSSDSSDTDSDILTTQSPIVQNIMSDSTRFYLPNPRSVLQRRNTISGSSPFCNRPTIDINQFWRELKQGTNHTGSSFDTHKLDNEITLSDPLSLRDKSASCGYGLELSPRPKTCLGVSLNAKVNRSESKGKDDKIPTINNTFKTEIMCYISDDGDLLKKNNLGDIEKNIKSVRFNQLEGKKDSVDIDGKILTADDHIPYVDDEQEFKIVETQANFINTDNADEIATPKMAEKDNTHMKFVYPHLNRQDDSLSVMNAVQNATIKTLSSTSKESKDSKPTIEIRSVFSYAPEPPPRPLNTLKPIGKNTGVIIEQKNLNPDLKIPLNDCAINKHKVHVMEADNLLAGKSQAKDSCDIPKIDSPKALSVAPSMKSLLGKSRNIRKKNSLINKRRCVSPKELLLTVPPPIKQGWLFQRVRSKNHELAKWEKRLFILMDSILYGFYSLQAVKACCMLMLPGYTVSLANEVKSRELAFRVYHTGTVFYFSAESQDELTQWLQYLGRATLSRENMSETRDSKLYSESDTSDEEKDNSNLSAESNAEQIISRTDQKNIGQKTISSNSEKNVKSEKSHNLKFGSLKKFARGKIEDNFPSSTSLDRKYLRFFSKNSDKSKYSEKNVNKGYSDVPTPTAQYRSYRKIVQTIPIAPHLSTSAESTSGENSKGHEESRQRDMKDEISVSHKQIRKIPAPINYTHASNPNLIDFDASDFANKTHQFKSPSEKLPTRSDNLLGFVTLEQFMLDKQKEEMAQLYSNRVLCGIEGARLKDIEENKSSKERPNKKNDDLQKQLQMIIPDVIYGQLNQKATKSLPRKLENLLNLPKTPDLAPPVKNDVYKSLPRKLFQNNFDEGYEIISIPDDNATSGGTQNEGFVKVIESGSGTKHPSHDTRLKKNYFKDKNKITDDPDNILLNNDLFIKRRNSEIMDNSKDNYYKSNKDNDFIANTLDNSDGNYKKSGIHLKPTAQYTPMNLPLNTKISNQTVDINLDKSDFPISSNFVKLRNIFQTSLDNSHKSEQNRDAKYYDKKHVADIAFSSQCDKQSSK